MSSTEYVADRRDMLFVLNEVFEAEKLCALPDFSDFTQELFTMIVNEASTFAEKVLAPLNKIGDQGCRVENGQVITPPGFREAWKALGKGGWLGLNVAPEFGGQGLPELVSVAARESLIASNQAFSLSFILTSGAANLIAAFGSDAQKATYCEKMYSGEWAGSMCLTEPNAGSAVGDIRTTAEKQGDHYVIKGSKQFITSGEHDFTPNIIHLVLARTPGSPPGPKGISLFIVPKVRPDGTFNDVNLVNIEHKMGLNGSPTCLLSFGDNNQCHGYLLQEENQGMAQMFQLMNEARLQVALQGLAGSAAAYHNAHAYANERIQGIPIQHGKDQAAARALIVEHPDVRRMLLHMKATTEGLRALMYACGYYTDMSHSGPENTRSYYQDLLDLHIPIAKSFATDQGFEIASTGIQVLGGVGYTRDFPLEQNTRDLKIAAIYEGTNGIQALDLVTRKFGLKNGALIQALHKELQFFESGAEVPEVTSRLLQEWGSYRTLMFETIQHLQTLAKSGGPRGYVLYACPMLNVMGDVLCAFWLLRQSAVAERQFQEIKGDKTPEIAVKENAEAAFYWNKILTAEHYIFSILPRALGNARIIKNGNFAALNARLEL